MTWLATLIGTLSILFLSTNALLLQDTTGKVHLDYSDGHDGLQIVLRRGDEIKLKGTLAKGKSANYARCIGNDTCVGAIERFSITPIEHGFNVTWHSRDPLKATEDCFDLEIGSTNWYGGPERYYQPWPLEKMAIDGKDPYVIKKADNFAVAERYWLNSKGVFIFLDDTVPLWVDQNTKNAGHVCFKAEAVAPYINRQEAALTYVIKTYNNAKEAHLRAVNDYLGKPAGHPDDRMITEPIWTTWAKYKQGINDAVVLQFASDIRNHGYENGQLEIDDKWEVCYGAQVFRTDTFPDIANTVKTLKENNWRVSLWIHPFVNDDCNDNANIGKANGYFVANTYGQTQATWWDGASGHQVDFTKYEAASWWSNRLWALHSYPGIDSFKFDAGETDYVNQPAVYDDVNHAPNILTTKYVDTCAQFGNLIEVRSAFRTQKYPFFIRMIDKASNWGLWDGLESLVTTLLQMNMNGYGMVLPDMIGGNGYAGAPTGELIVRWTQANAFMPSMQFSYLPWDYTGTVSFDIEAIVKKYVLLHAEYAPKIIAAMEKSIQDGSPVNPPIWWIDPTDQIALAVADEYLVGEDILVAPVLTEGVSSRTIYLPVGQWRDGNNGEVIQGPTYLYNYKAPIDVLPWFIKV